VKNSMVIGKFCLFITAASFSTQLAAQTIEGDSVTGRWDFGSNISQLFSNVANWRGDLLDSYDKALYQQSLMFMLENVPLGQTVEWRSDRNYSVRGQMRVIYGYQTSNGYCRVFQSEVFRDGQSTSWQEYACVRQDNPHWQFYNK
jgi:surface antigen